MKRGGSDMRHLSRLRLVAAPWSFSAEVLENGTVQWNNVQGRLTPPWPHENIVGELECVHGRVVFSVNQLPFSEELGISLWSPNGQCLEKILMAGYLAEGSFENLTIAEPGQEQAEFQFFGSTEGATGRVNDTWILEVNSQPRLAIPFFPDAMGVVRSGAFRRWMRLERRRSK